MSRVYDTIRDACSFGGAIASGAVLYLALATPHVLPTPGPSPAPVPALAITAKSYHDGIPKEFKDAGAAVRKGSIKTADDLAAFFGSHASPLGKSVSTTAKAHADASGNIADAAGLADELDSVANHLGSK